jgi:hypothetical protein
MIDVDWHHHSDDAGWKGPNRHIVRSCVRSARKTKVVDLPSDVSLSPHHLNLGQEERSGCSLANDEMGAPRTFVSLSSASSSYRKKPNTLFVATLMTQERWPGSHILARRSRRGVIWGSREKVSRYTNHGAAAAATAIHKRGIPATAAAAARKLGYGDGDGGWEGDGWMDNKQRQARQVLSNQPPERQKKEEGATGGWQGESLSSVHAVRQSKTKERAGPLHHPSFRRYNYSFPTTKKAERFSRGPKIPMHSIMDPLLCCRSPLQKCHLCYAKSPPV